MTNHNLNYNAAPPTYVGVDADDAEPHGRAALILVESLIHGLLARSVIDVADAVEIVDAAIEVEETNAIDRGAPAETRRVAASVLAAISASLSRDLPNPPNDGGQTPDREGTRS